MAPRSLTLTAAALAAAGSSLLLTGCGAGGTTTTAPAPPSPAPTPGPSPPGPAPAPAPAPAPTTAAPTQAPTTAPNTVATTQAPTQAPTTTTPCPDLPADACVVTETHGCLDGQSFAYLDQFPCGAKQPPYTRVALYDWQTTSCCAQGLPFVTSDSFCCYDGVHSFSAGECKDWSPDLSESCRCTGSSSSALDAEAPAAVAEVAAVDTLSTTPACPCGGPTETSGCLNGHLYDYATEMPCGNYIANMDTHGCCPTADGIKSFSLENESCCREGDTNVIRSTAHACDCRLYGCDGSLFSTVI